MSFCVYFVMLNFATYWFGGNWSIPNLFFGLTKKKQTKKLAKILPGVGFEPSTFSLWERRVNQLRHRNYTFMEHTDPIKLFWVAVGLLSNRIHLFSSVITARKIDREMEWIQEALWFIWLNKTIISTYGRNSKGKWQNSENAYGIWSPSQKENTSSTPDGDVEFSMESGTNQMK